MQEQVTFITRRVHKISDPRILVTDSLKPLTDFLNSVKVGEMSGLDTENNSLNPFVAVPLLAQFGNGENVFVVDRTCFDLEFLREYSHITWIGQNLQYDDSIIRWNEGGKPIILGKYLDIMVNEQVIGRGIGRSNSLEAVHLRRLGTAYPENKEIRDEFIKMNKNSVFEDRHIIYAGSDIRCLHKIYEAQELIINQQQLGLRTLGIGQPLVTILSEMCLNGSKLDNDRWMLIYNENKKKRNDYEVKLDKELQRLGYKNKIRKTEEVLVFDLFGPPAEVSNQNLKKINYGSPKQILKIFKHFGLPIPMGKDTKTYELKPSIKGEALEQYMIDHPSSMLKPFIKLLIEHKGVVKRINSFGINFIHDVYPDPSKPNAKNNLIYGFYNPQTGKVHTKYKQEFTANGRLSSGSDNTKDDGKTKNKKKKHNVFFNSQQLPKENRYRECFILEPELVKEGWYRTTFDLSGAELVILGALSGDTKLLELQASDLHSYISTAAFNDIIKYILEHMPPNRIRMELYDLLKVNKVFEILTVTEKDEQGNERFVRFYTQEEKDEMTRLRIDEALSTGGFKINKGTAKDIRDAVKNAVYAACYGATDNRIAETLGIAKDYANIFLRVMARELPIAFGFLDRVAKQAIREGYVVFNTRTNSRHIFKKFLEAQKYGRELNKGDRGELERAAKNYIISGTQADMIKESMVEIDKYLKTGYHEILGNDKDAKVETIPHKWIFQIHDECVIDHKGFEQGQAISKIASAVCNRYLNGLAEMKANTETLDRWTK